MTDPDPELIKRARDGDRTSLKALLKEVEPAVRQWARSHAGDSDSAADLSQEVLLLMIRKIGSYRGDARFLSWLFTVTRNQAVEETRRKARHRNKMNRLRTEIGHARHASNPAEEHLDRGRIRAVVHAFVRELPQRQREVFQMSELQGLSSPEIGEILDLQPVSVRAALLKARRALRKKIVENHPELMEEYLS
jgi:RNA polymerase sigma-70 factor (ECF subfamily)